MSRRRFSCVLAIVAISAFMLTPATRAQDWAGVNVYLMDGGAFTNALMANSLVERMEWAMEMAGEEPTTSSPSKSKTAPSSEITASLSFRPIAGTNTARDLAASYPADKRAEAEALFQQLLTMFADVERQFGQPSRDLPTALALFIGTSYEAATGREMQESHQAPLVSQLRSALSADPSITGASDADKQRMYEQFAIIGMMTGGTTLALEQTPNEAIAAKLKTAGDGYLRQVLKLNPANIEFTDQGMQIVSR